ncbi:outer membrane beta-barrel family protein [Myroides fluvii]|uniref:outer membrane beta-barrel family protein n=1 Tax=Myroides fluvii TaxID=2572594 RepID=UPI00131DC430|nr:outer membrane beta-barrel family protein [Myroides fluvii]
MSTLFCSFFFILLLLGGRCYGQSFTIEGQVVNTKNQPIEFMDVYLTYTSDSNMPQVYTDSLGRFILNAERGIYTLKIDQFGKELWMKTIDLVKDIDLGVLAIDNAVLLEEVTINAIKNFVKYKGDKLLFDIENSPLAKGYNGLEVLRRSPKLQISSDGSIQLRKKEVQVLVNGRKATMGQEDLNHYLESLSSEDIRSIEIQDVAAADAEASNSGGIVNIVLKKEIYGLRGIVKTSGTYYKPRYNNFFGDINLIYGHEKWNVYFTSGVSKNRSKGLYNNQFDYSNSRRQHQYGIFLQDNKSYNFRTGIVFYPNIKHEFGGEFFLRNGKDRLTDYQLLKIYNPTLAIEGETNSLTHDKTAIWYVTINYKYSIDTLGSYLKFIGDYGSNRLNRYNTGNIIYALGQVGDSNFLFDTKAPSIYYTGQVDWLQKLKSNWQLFSGVKFNRIARSNELNSSEKRDQDWQLMPKGIEDFKNTENIVAFYTSIEKSITKHNYLKVGLRGEFTSVTGINKINNEDVKVSYVDLFPSLFYKYSIDNKRFLSLSYRRSINRPSFRDLNPFVIKQSDFLFQKGNPDLTPQYNQRIDLTYGTSKNEFSLFTRFSKDLIQQVYFVKDSTNYVQPLNFGKEYNSGIDHTYSGNITKWLYVNVSSGVYYYSFKSSELKKSRPTCYNYIYLQATLPKSYLIELFSNYDYQSQYRNILGAYQYGLDVTVQKKMVGDQLIAKLYITDLLNTRRDKNRSTYTDFTFDFYQKRLTRGVTFSIQYTFNNQGKTKYSNVQSDNQSRNRL